MNVAGALEDETRDGERAAAERGRYLTRVHQGLRDEQARAVAYRELGWSSSGIARKVDVGKATVQTWLEQVATRHGLRAVETKPESEREGPLPTPATDELRAELSPGVLAEYLELAQRHPGHVPGAVDVDALRSGGDGR